MDKERRPAAGARDNGHRMSAFREETTCGWELLTYKHAWALSLYPHGYVPEDQEERGERKEGCGNGGREKHLIKGGGGAEETKQNNTAKRVNIWDMPAGGANGRVGGLAVNQTEGDRRSRRGRGS